MARRLEDRPVYLLGALAEVDSTDRPGMFDPVPPQVCLVGLFDVIEFCPYETSNYVYSPYYLVAAHGVEDGPCYAVGVQDFVQQVNPDSHARELVQERDMDNRELDEDQEG